MASRAFWRDACSVVAAAEYRCANDDDKVSARPPEGALATTTISARKDATTDKGGKAFSFDTFCPLQPLLSCAHRNRTSKHDSQTGLNGADKSDPKTASCRLEQQKIKGLLCIQTKIKLQICWACRTTRTTSLELCEPELHLRASHLPLRLPPRCQPLRSARQRSDLISIC